MLYFVQDSRTCDIKIGFTEGDSAVRLAALQTGNPGRLVLLFECEGDRAAEAGLHRRFATARVQGEWFRPVPELIGYLMAGAEQRAFMDGLLAESDARLRSDAAYEAYKHSPEYDSWQREMIAIAAGNRQMAN